MLHQYKIIGIGILHKLRIVDLFGRQFPFLCIAIAETSSNSYALLKKKLKTGINSFIFNVALAFFFSIKIFKYKILFNTWRALRSNPPWK